MWLRVSAGSSARSASRAGGAALRAAPSGRAALRAALQRGAFGAPLMGGAFGTPLSTLNSEIKMQNPELSNINPESRIWNPERVTQTARHQERCRRSPTHQVWADPAAQTALLYGRTTSRRRLNVLIKRGGPLKSYSAEKHSKQKARTKTNKSQNEAQGTK